MPDSTIDKMTQGLTTLTQRTRRRVIAAPWMDAQISFLKTSKGLDLTNFLCGAANARRLTSKDFAQR